eukprot:TRINITY_DN2719_c0_g4_i2.p1 TRINITY_DN2719_c0_g4~~TRINITY_DN2719_c0_g4_i2.p1  ORF type:complete len:583 (+),score=118.18 TRINITY_DN2719_c0_g4_i2:88-1836(+)
MASQARKPGVPLQLVTLNMEERKVDVNEDALGRLEKRLKELGAQSVAIVSVMGAFRTGKSFMLDLFLRYLRYEADHGTDNSNASAPARGGEEEYPLPAWIRDAGECLEGAKDLPDEVVADTEGFRFKGGMDACTEGIWIWSEPFIRTLQGRKVAVLLMDTQGAWDSNMTKEQSATIFGLTAVLSSKQIYNINMQIQEDKVENLAYFMRFAQAAIRKAASEMKNVNTEELDRPFQSLDFLVRDWRHFQEEWTVDQCREQMQQHLDRHVNPKKVVENSTSEALVAMFHDLSCFCMPHPGLAIEREKWTGKVSDISSDFIRFADVYVRQVFSEALAPKKILGSELSTITFPMILRNFVSAFHDAAPAAMSFTQAMTNCTVLLAKEQALKSYSKKMDEATGNNPRGIEPVKFEELHRTVSGEVQDAFKGVTIFGSDETRTSAWDEITTNLASLHKRYSEENDRRLEKALVTFAPLALLGLVLFILDRMSDWTCDWWSQTCTDLSKLMLLAYGGIAAYVGYHVYVLFKDRGQIGAAMAGGELWKEMIRLSGVYIELAKQLKFDEVVDAGKKAFASVTGGDAAAKKKD